MGDWQTMDTAPREGEFLATDGVLMGVGSFYRTVAPDTTFNTQGFEDFRAEVFRPFGEIPWEGGTWAEGFDYLEWNRKRDAAWEARKHEFTQAFIPNPDAGKVTEWFGASAFFAFDGVTSTQDYDGPVYFTPTLWQPLPTPPTPRDE